jgi:SAM-dependent methyltransferase
MYDPLQRSYDVHPLNARAIQRRLSRQGKTMPTALDLALDPETDITDQNHIGGLATVIQLAEAASVTSRSLVCDLGGGLGGPARCLATLFGCNVHVIDSSLRRCQDADDLNALVRLAHKVTVECGDIRTMTVRGSFDVLWGQSSWTHLDNIADVLTRWMAILARGGRLACEDMFIVRQPDDLEHRKLADLKTIWSCRIPTRGTWNDLLQASGCAIETFDDLTFLLEPHLSRLLRSGQEPEDSERRGWMLALELSRSGVLGYGRWIGIRN